MPVTRSKRQIGNRKVFYAKPAFKVGYQRKFNFDTFSGKYFQASNQIDETKFIPFTFLANYLNYKSKITQTRIPNF